MTGVQTCALPICFPVTIPVAVGLGVSNRDQANEVASYADGVIVGSAFIKVIQEFGSGRKGLKKDKELAKSLSEGVSSARKI